jgi:hypothetical protein
MSSSPPSFSDAVHASGPAAGHTAPHCPGPSCCRPTFPSTISPIQGHAVLTDLCVVCLPTSPEQQNNFFSRTFVSRLLLWWTSFGPHLPAPAPRVFKGGAVPGCLGAPPGQGRLDHSWGHHVYGWSIFLRNPFSQSGFPAVPVGSLLRPLLLPVCLQPGPAPLSCC